MSDWLTLRDALGLTLRPIDAWPGRPNNSRSASPFSAPFKDTLAKLRRELSALSARGIVLQVAFRERDLRQDGLPRADARAEHPGVILAFESRHGPLRLVFDSFTKWQDNLRAVAFHLEHLRMASLYGVGRDGQQYQGWKALPAPDESPFSDAVGAAQWLHDLTEVPGIYTDRAAFISAYRRAAAELHPDVGGDHGRFVLLGRAKELLDRHHSVSCTTVSAERLP